MAWNEGFWSIWNPVPGCVFAGVFYLGGPASAIAGAIVGYTEFGILGGVPGVPIGFVAGVVSLWLLVCAVVFVWMSGWAVYRRGPRGLVLLYRKGPVGVVEDQRRREQERG